MCWYCPGLDNLSCRCLRKLSLVAIGSTGLPNPPNSPPCWSDRGKSAGLWPPERQLEQGWIAPDIRERYCGIFDPCGKILSLASTSSQSISGFSSSWCPGSTPTPGEGCHLPNSRFCCLQHLYLPISHPKQWPNPAFIVRNVMVKVPTWPGSIYCCIRWDYCSLALANRSNFSFCCKHWNVCFYTLIIRDGNKREDNKSPHSIAIIWPWSELFTAVGAKCTAEVFFGNWCDISVSVSQKLEVSLKIIKPIRLLTLPTRCTSEFHRRLSCKKYQSSLHKYGWN